MTPLTPDEDIFDDLLGDLGILGIYQVDIKGFKFDYDFYSKDSVIQGEEMLNGYITSDGKRLSRVEKIRGGIAFYLGNNREIVYREKEFTIFIKTPDLKFSILIGPDFIRELENELYKDLWIRGGKVPDGYSPIKKSIDNPIEDKRRRFNYLWPPNLSIKALSLLKINLNTGEYKKPEDIIKELNKEL